MTEKRISKVSSTDLQPLEDRTRGDAPEGPSLGRAFWKRARVVVPQAPKTQITLRLDADLVAWLKAGGKGYQTRINAVLRSYYEAHREERR